MLKAPIVIRYDWKARHTFKCRQSTKCYLLIFTVCILLGFYHSISTRVNPKEFSNYVSVRDGTPLRLRCATCALVSNSGHVVGSYLGQSIDQHDCVFRMNAAPTGPFSDDVGNRCSIRVVSVEDMEEIFKSTILRHDLGEILIVYDHTLQHQSNEFSRRIRLVNTETVVYELSKSGFGATEGLLRKYRTNKNKNSNVTESPSTTAFMTFTIAMNVCEESISMYGFVEANYCKFHAHPFDAPYHYFPPYDQTPFCQYRRPQHQASSSLPTQEEYKAIEDIIRDCGSVRFYSPEWANHFEGAV